ncbi:hypothetical protein FD733_18470 [Pantoea sp. Eser]|nr:hypothetical protein [Pantoea sp. Eser]
MSKKPGKLESFWRQRLARKSDDSHTHFQTRSELIPAEQGRDKYHFHCGKCNPWRLRLKIHHLSSIKCCASRKSLTCCYEKYWFDELTHSYAGLRKNSSGAFARFLNTPKHKKLHLYSLHPEGAYRRFPLHYPLILCAVEGVIYGAKKKQSLMVGFN